MKKIDLIIDALSVAQNSVWSALNQEALAYAIELKLELAKPEQEEVKVDIGVDVTAEGTSVVAFNCRADEARECFYAEWHPMPKRVPVEWDDDEWVKTAMEMSRDFVERAKKNWESPPKGVGTVTMAELRKTDLYRKVQTQLLRDILRDDNT